MNDFYYTTEKNAQMLLYLLKKHGIKKIIASPGATNVAVVASMQHDPYFEMYSCVDERSAAYMACGMAEESGEPVVLSCTGATSSRNYLPGLTEAFYRMLPILVVTSSMTSSKKGHLYAQFTDRSTPPSDCVKKSYLVQTIKDSEDYWDCNVKLNDAILELTHGEAGPVHINLETSYSTDFSVRELPVANVIKRISMNDPLPPLPKGKVAIFIGQHKRMNKVEEDAIDKFCFAHNAVVISDHTSNYKGVFNIPSALVSAQESGFSEYMEIDTLIHIGEISGEYYSLSNIRPKEVWRVSKDGQLRDRFKKLKNVFELDELDFFNLYSNEKESKGNSNYGKWNQLYDSLLEKMPELPLSTIFVAQKFAQVIPDGVVLYLSILNVLRSWNFFRIKKSIDVVSNVGGFGIDGMTSSLIGASLVDNKKLYFAMTGDLNFFYDLNVLGNRHLGSNIRILLVNNGHGQEFRTYKHGASIFGEETDEYIAAARHFGNKSNTLVKSYVENLGFDYLSASSKEEFLSLLPIFCDKDIKERPMVFEVFTNNEDEYESLKLLRNLSPKALDQKTKETISEIRHLGKSLLNKVIK